MKNSYSLALARLVELTEQIERLCKQVGYECERHYEIGNEKMSHESIRPPGGAWRDDDGMSVKVYLLPDLNYKRYSFDYGQLHRRVTVSKYINEPADIKMPYNISIRELTDICDDAEALIKAFVDNAEHMQKIMRARADELAGKIAQAEQDLDNYNKALEEISAGIQAGEGKEEENG